MGQEQKTNKIELSREDAYFVAGLLNRVKHNRMKYLSEEENTEMYFKITDVFNDIIKQLSEIK